MNSLILSKKKQLRVLVTDGENRSALAVTRSLGKLGCQVTVASPFVRSLASVSRYCTHGVVVPDPLTAGDEYCAAICEIVKSEETEVLFPVTEQSIYLLNPLRNCQLKNLMLACPLPQMMQAVSNKFQLFQLAEKLGVSVPQTFYLNNAGSLKDIIAQIVHYPVVVKPSLSRILVDGEFIAGGVCYAKTRTELEEIYAANPVLQFPSLIQEKIIGPGTGLFTLYDKNRHLVLFSHKRLREKPPSGGVSVVSESVPLDDEMVASTGKLLSTISFAGVAMVEFKRDLRDGKAKLMEINGRFWGSLQLAIACGVDFPAWYLKYLQGRLPDKVFCEYSVGHKLKWFFGTLDHLLIRLKHDDAALNLGDNIPNKLQAVFQFLQIWQRNASFDVANIKDMKPFFRESAIYLKSLFSGK